LDKSLPGPDHRSSINPEELKQLVCDIRKAELALGKAEKRPLESEKENRQKLRKSIVAKIDIKKGVTISRDMLSIKRPGTGISPSDYEKVVGRQSLDSIMQDSLIEWNQIK